jgi:LPS export ABC transporter protein LptC/lipopolysaccharide transport protein LptA
MTLNQIRLVKHLLAVVLVGFSAIVAYQLLRSSLADPPRPSDAALPTDRENPMARGVEISRLDAEGNRVFELRAAESVGRSEGVQIFRDVEIEFVAGETEAVPLTVTGDLCRYDVDSSAVHLEGNVVIRDEEGLRIETSTLDYGSKPKRVWTDRPLRFSRGDLVGDAGGLVYHVRNNAFELIDEVAMTLTPEKGLPVQVESETAKIRRDEGFVRYVGNVRVRQGTRRLNSERLRIDMTEDESGVKQIVAEKNVKMVLDVPPPDAEDTEDEEDSTSGLPPLEEPGRKRLTCEKLDVVFRPDGSTMQRMRADDEAKLTLEPYSAAGEKSGMRHVLEGKSLAFDFDPEGRLRALRGRGGVALTLEPESGRPEDTRRVTARELESRFDPETGDLRMAECRHAVTFSQGDLHGEAEKGVYRAGRELLTLTESPRLWDSSSELVAEEVRIQVVTGGLEAEGKVRSTMTSASSSKSIGFLPGSEDEAVYFLADRLDYDREQDIAVYTGTARGFRGTNRLEAERIEVAQTKGELEATDSVRTALPQNTAPGEGTEEATPQLTFTRAGHLFYRSKDEVLTYRDGVQMTSGDLVLRGEKVDVSLEEGGKAVKRIDAEGQVEIESTTGRARGEQATYVPDREEVHVRGERATLQDGDKLTEGKELTFFLSDDRIFVDGREERRTKTIYSRSRPF